MNRHLVHILLAALLVIPTAASAQQTGNNSHQLNQIQQKLRRQKIGQALQQHSNSGSHSHSNTAIGRKQLTLQQMKSATQFTYCCDNGSLPPEYAWQYSVIITPHSSRVYVHYGYDSGDGVVDFVTADETLTTAQYQRFQQALAVRKVSFHAAPANYDPPVGGGAESLTVNFTGNVKWEGSDIQRTLTVGNGELITAFETVLTQTQQMLLHNPEAYRPDPNTIIGPNADPDPEGHIDPTEEDEWMTVE
ncbi:MAG: hypothetical protein IJ710_05425 [Prevotella sp.]|nr:hypothetical protein [Prevotella sp.]